MGAGCFIGPGPLNGASGVAVFLELKKGITNLPFAAKTLCRIGPVGDRLLLRRRQPPET